MKEYLEAIRKAINEISNNLSIEEKETLAVPFSTIQGNLKNLEDMVSDLHIYKVTYKDQYNESCTKIIAHSVIGAVCIVTRNKPMREVLSVTFLGDCKLE